MLNDLFSEYSKAHQNPVNKTCHRIGIPLIVGSLIVLMWDVRSIAAWSAFLAGWVLQILGHWIEGTRPEFLKNPLFLLVGPLYFIRQIFLKILGRPQS